MRILVVTNKPPLPALLTGGGQRTDLLLRALERSGEVDLVVVGPQGLCTDDDLAPVRARYRLLGRCTWTTRLWAGSWRFPAGWLPGLPGRTAEALALQTRRYSVERDLARWLGTVADVGRYTVVVGRPLEPLLRAGILGTRARVVLDVDDLDSEVLRQRLAAGEHTQPRAIEEMLIRRLRAIEARALGACDHFWLASEEDHRRRASPHGTLLPNVPWTPEDRPAVAPHPSRSDSTAVLFVGSLRYEPNADGVARFIREAWPRVRAAIPTAVLRLVGPPPAPSVQAQWRRAPGVEIAGYVDDLAETYAAAAVTIAPLTWGGGTSIKVLESLAHARPCVLTARTLAGFASFLRHGESVWCAADVPAMAEGCIRLLRDGELRRAMGERGCHAVEENASMHRFAQIVGQTLDEVVRRERRPAGLKVPA